MGKDKNSKKKPVVEKGKKSFKQALSHFYEKNEEQAQKKQDKRDRIKQQQQQQQQQGKAAIQNNNQQRNKGQGEGSSSSSAAQGANTMTHTATTKLSNLQQQFLKKLEGARFRQINEELYTKRGDFAFREFQRDPSKFDIYHRGYREQAAQWPMNPLDNIIDFILKHHRKAVIADMGCGDARIAASVPNKVHSFDLVAVNDSVTACDISHVPLPDESVDIVVFCLSLMGTNMTDFIREGARILKTHGILKIAEVRSRFGDNKGILDFIKFMKRAGFEVKPHDKLSENKMFFEVECTKVTNEVYIDNTIELKACQYKKR